MQLTFSREDLQRVILAGIRAEMGMSIEMVTFGVEDISRHKRPYGRSQEEKPVYVVTFATQPIMRYSKGFSTEEGIIIIDDEATCFDDMVVAAFEDCPSGDEMAEKALQRLNEGEDPETVLSSL